MDHQIAWSNDTDTASFSSRRGVEKGGDQGIETESSERKGSRRDIGGKARDLEGWIDDGMRKGDGEVQAGVKLTRCDESPRAFGDYSPSRLGRGGTT